MKAVTSLLLCLLTTSAMTAADARYVIDDPYAGFYQGTTQSRFHKGIAEAQIRSLGNGSYDGFIVLKSVKDGEETISSINVITAFQPDAEQKAAFAAIHPNMIDQNRDTPDARFSWPALALSGEITPGKITGAVSGPFMREGESTFSLSRTAAPPSATLGAEPPPGAIVVFGGKDRGQWKEARWPVKDGVLEVGPGNITTKQSLTNFLLHLEFRTPHMPAALGQARGNSGVYLQSIFEVQVLDSFGLFPLQNNDCGGIYQVAAPDWKAVNACLPPGEWQTYDITFRAGDERTARLPEITVVHNGKTVVDRAKVPANLMTNGTGGGEVGGGFLMLQNHKDAVQYRNIWALPIE